MGQIPKKYHITEEGDIYKINDDGSFTSMGNVEKNDFSHSDEQEECMLILETPGKVKLAVVKVLASYITNDLKQAKDMVDSSPCCIAPRINMSQGKIIAQELEKIGAVVSLSPISSHSKTLEDRQYNGRELLCLEEKILKGKKSMNTLSYDEACFVAKESRNIEALVELFFYSGLGKDTLNENIFSILFQRYLQDDDLGPLGYLFSAGVYDDSDKIRMLLASTPVAYDDIEYVLRQLAKDKNPDIREAAISSRFYSSKKSGCLGLLFLPLVIALVCRLFI